MSHVNFFEKTYLVADHYNYMLFVRLLTMISDLVEQQMYKTNKTSQLCTKDQKEIARVNILKSQFLGDLIPKYCTKSPTRFIDHEQTITYPLLGLQIQALLFYTDSCPVKQYALLFTSKVLMNILHYKKWIMIEQTNKYTNVNDAIRKIHNYTSLFLKGLKPYTNNSRLIGYLSPLDPLFQIVKTAIVGGYTYNQLLLQMKPKEPLNLPPSQPGDVPPNTPMLTRTKKRAYTSNINNNAKRRCIVTDYDYEDYLNAEQESFEANVSANMVFQDHILAYETREQRQKNDPELKSPTLP